MSSQSRKAGFLVDRRRRAGAGHWRRSRTLAHALAERGWQCHVRLRSGTESITADPRLASQRRLDADSPDYRDAVAGQNWHLTVIDDYSTDARDEEALAHWTGRLLVIDDSPARQHRCDMLVDQTCGRQPVEYDGLVPLECTVLAGSKFAMLEEPYRDLAAKVGARRRAAPAQRVVVSFGGVDHPNTTLLALTALAMIDAPWSIDVVLGPDYAHADMLKDVLRQLGPRATVHHAPSDLARLYLSADVAIGAAGTTSWERCCLGLPAVVLINAENQRDIAAGLAEAGAASLCVPRDAVTAADVAVEVERLMTDDVARHGMAQKAAGLCDGGGAELVATAVEALISP